MILLSDFFSPLLAWSRSLCSNSPESLMNTRINVPGAGEEIIGSSLGSSASYVPSISMAQALQLQPCYFFFTALLWPSPVQPIFVTDSETLSVSAAHVSVFTTIPLTAVTLIFRVTEKQQKQSQSCNSILWISVNYGKQGWDIVVWVESKGQICCACIFLVTKKSEDKIK